MPSHEVLVAFAPLGSVIRFGACAVVATAPEARIGGPMLGGLLRGGISALVFGCVVASGAELRAQADRPTDIVVGGSVTRQGGVLGGPIGGTPMTPLSPVDGAGCGARADFFAFRARLQAALARRDFDAVLAIVAPDIKNSFGGDDGIEGFLRLWTPREPGSKLWEELATVLALGGTFEGDDMFVAPYVFSRWPQAFDAFQHVALIAPDVALRLAPRDDAEPAGIASFVILRLAGSEAPEGWTAIRGEDGRARYVRSSVIRSPVGYRACFERRNGEWRMVMFLAGD
jgi:hypothetical protein